MKGQQKKYIYNHAMMLCMQSETKLKKIHLEHNSQVSRRSNQFAVNLELMLD